MDHQKEQCQVTKNEIDEGLFSFSISNDKPYSRLQNVCCVSSESNLKKILQIWKIKAPGLVFSFSSGFKSESKPFKHFLLNTVRLTGAAITTEEPSKNDILKKIVKDIERDSDFIPPTIGILSRTQKNKDIFHQLHKGYMSAKWTTVSHCTHLVFVQQPYTKERALSSINEIISGDVDSTPVVVFTNTHFIKPYPKTHILVNVNCWYEGNPPEELNSRFIKTLYNSYFTQKPPIKTVLKFALVLKADKYITKIVDKFGNNITDEDKAEILAYTFKIDKWDPAIIKLTDFIRNPNIYKILQLCLHEKECKTSNLRDFEQHDCTISGVSNKRHSRILCLFLWAIENQRFTVANELWRQTDNMMCAALFANQCLQAMIVDNTTEVNDLKNIEKKAEEYNERAEEILTKCLLEKNEKTKKILVRKRDELAGKSLLQIAKYNRQFIAHDACYSKVNEIWFSPLETLHKRPPKWLLLVCVLLSILAPLLLPIRTEIAAKYNKETDNDYDKKKKKQRPNVKEYGIMVLHFLNAPIVKFTYHVPSFLTFLAFFAYDLTFDVSEFTWNDGIVFAFVVSFITEEIRQVYGQGRHYVRNVWNWIDISSLALFITGQSLMITYCCSEGGRVLLAVSFIGFSIRLLQVFASLSQIGPLLIMIARMLVDTVYFLGVLSVVVISYAVSSRAIFYTNSRFTWSSLYMTFWKPYWHIFGELFLDEIKGDAECEAVGTVLNSTKSCPATMVQYVMPVLLGVYMIIVHVLLINLLIAKFTFTVTKVQDDIGIHWRYLRFHFVNEYSERTLIFPPFSFVYHVCLLIYLFAKKICPASKGGDKKTFYREYDSYCVNFKERENTNLKDWENKLAKICFPFSRIPEDSDQNIESVLADEHKQLSPRPTKPVMSTPARDLFSREANEWQN